ncbi:uncharacterized protein MELLADRAFT_69871 [Melampsora larici-populina 98AG31]|uniref:Uncharacterized protein n=1 Tax=Melampsora larici-populina (strain 98AG31 / pathotype 3-4-7) TaxID=747676 RepID=F4SCL0_MELLP|nr:uncharacterized protein MELLADRAFT_69871 [Melampsora larici-populina 98AG31]EGF97618.1 hypothetical protein MELLADRAFT_69871 [Melampsora larici-populina 98AG31]
MSVRIDHDDILKREERVELPNENSNKDKDNHEIFKANEEQWEIHIKILQIQIHNLKMWNRINQDLMKKIFIEVDSYTLLTNYYRFVPFGDHIHELVENDPDVKL